MFFMFLSGTNGTKFRKTSIEKKKKKLGRNISYPQKQPLPYLEN